MSKRKTIDFSEAYYKIDKWAVDDPELQDTYYNILDDTEMSKEEKISEMEELLDLIISDFDRLDSYIGERWTLKEFAEWIINRYEN